jgi:hypothetical protein
MTTITNGLFVMKKRLGAGYGPFLITGEDDRNKHPLW